MSKYLWVSVFAFCLAPSCARLHAQPASRSICPRPAIGSVVAEPEDLRSQNGELEADLTARDAPGANARPLYCYTDAAGRESPTLRVKTGALVIFLLKQAVA